MPKIPVQLPNRAPIVLDSDRPGDRRRLARLLALLVWRLAKEQETQASDSESSQQSLGEHKSSKA
jgi:hypothetical protein